MAGTGTGLNLNDGVKHANRRSDDSFLSANGGDILPEEAAGLIEPFLDPTDLTPINNRVQKLEANQFYGSIKYRGQVTAFADLNSETFTEQRELFRLNSSNTFYLVVQRESGVIRDNFKDARVFIYNLFDRTYFAAGTPIQSNTYDVYTFTTGRANVAPVVDTFYQFDVWFATTGGSGGTSAPDPEVTYADITALLADQNAQEIGEDYLVFDATDDNRITSGRGYYALATKTGNLYDDYILVNQEYISTGGATNDEELVVDGSGLAVFQEVTNQQEYNIANAAAILKARGTEVFGNVSVNINAGDNTAFDVGAIIGQISSDAGYFPIDYAGATAIPVTNISATSTYVYLDANVTIQQQTTAPTPTEYRQKLFLARLASNGSNLIAFEYLFNPSGQYTNTVRDFYEYVKDAGVPLRKGFEVTGNADATFDRAAGTVLEFGGNGDALSPNIKSLPAATPANLFILTQNSSIGAATTSFPFDVYDLNGVQTSLTNNRFVAHRLYLFSSGNHVIQLGQAQYSSLEEARVGIQSEDYIVSPTSLNGDLLGWWITQEGQTQTDQAEFLRYTIGGQGASAAAGSLLAANNLSDLENAQSARDNLGVYSTIEVDDLKQSILAEGPFVDGDKLKLNAIEANATADQTGGEIKAAYEAEADTNAFTDAAKSKNDNLPADTNAELADLQAQQDATDDRVDENELDIAELTPLTQAPPTTGTVSVPLDRLGGYDFTQAVCTLTNFTIAAGSIVGGNAIYRIQTATAPVITGATKLKNSEDHIPNVVMYLMFLKDNNRITYRLLEY